MIKQRNTLLIGILVIIIPFLGFPSWFRTSSIVLLGFLLIAFSIKLELPKKPLKRTRKKERVTEVFVENMPKIKTEDQSSTDEFKIE